MMNPDHSLRWWLRPSSSLQSVSACSRLRIQCFSVGMLHYKIISWWWLIGEGLLLKHLKRYYNRPHSSKWWVRCSENGAKTCIPASQAQRGTCRCQGHYPKQGGNHCFVQMVLR
jgi:hypothetical protein